jgi:hypothetical protein
MKGSMMRKKMIIMVAVAGLLFALAASANAELVTHYKLDETSGSLIAADATVNGNVGAMTSTTSVAGSPDPTSTTGISMPTGNYLDGVAPANSTYTIMFWVDIDFIETFCRFFTIGTDTLTTSELIFEAEDEGAGLLFGLTQYPDNKVEDGEEAIFEPVAGVITSGWQHHAAVVDGTSVSYYVDGTLAASGTLMSNVTSAQFRILGATVQLNPIGGSIDEVKVFDTALSETEIAENMAVSACDAVKAWDGYDVAAALEIGDFNYDCKVNLGDFADMAFYWLNGAGDATGLGDLDVMALNWLTDVTDE